MASITIDDIIITCERDESGSAYLTYTYQGQSYRFMKGHPFIQRGPEWEKIMWRECPKSVSKIAKKMTGNTKMQAMLPEWADAVKTKALEAQRADKSRRSGIVRMPGQADRTFTRRELSDYIDQIIEENAGYGVLHAYDDAEVDGYLKSARRNKRAIMAYFDSRENPVFDWDNTTDLPIIPTED